MSDFAIQTNYIFKLILWISIDIFHLGWLLIYYVIFIVYLNKVISVLLLTIQPYPSTITLGPHDNSGGVIMTVGGTMVTHVDTMYNSKVTSPFMYSFSIFLATQACTENSPKVTSMFC